MILFLLIVFFLKLIKFFEISRDISKNLINLRKKTINKNNIKNVISLKIKEFNKFKNVKVEYFELRNKFTLKKSYKKKNSKFFIAYYLKKIRLIDNF